MLSSSASRSSPGRRRRDSRLRWDMIDREFFQFQTLARHDPRTRERALDAALLRRGSCVQGKVASVGLLEPRLLPLLRDLSKYGAVESCPRRLPFMLAPLGACVGWRCRLGGLLPPRRFGCCGLRAGFLLGHRSFSASRCCSRQRTSPGEWNTVTSAAHEHQLDWAWNSAVFSIFWDA